MAKLPFETQNLTDRNIEKIAALFPNVITEIKDEEHSTPEKTAYKKGINFELLKQELSGDVADGDECYDFTWVGKKACIVEGNKPIKKTLRPCIEESKDWEHTGNLYIEGDNLDVLKLLQESYLNSVKMIYIDPPYNTGNDFIYKDDFAMDKDDYDEQISLYDDDGNRLFQNTESNGRFHSDWCSMMYPRLKLAQNLLTDDGVIFISIDDNEVHNLRKMCDEVFGESNFVACNIWQKRTTGCNKNFFLAMRFRCIFKNQQCYCAV
jgi:adenine-specific DNA-methyltransferase